MTAVPDFSQRRSAVDHAEFAGEFSLRPLDIDRDLDLIHGWMNDPDVAEFWRKAWPREHIAAYLRDQQQSSHSAAYVGELSGAPMSYWELYRADLDPLAEYYPACAHDAGVHLLIGPTHCRGRGLAETLLRLVSGWQLAADPKATRVVGEPDVRNERVIRVAERAGFRRVTTIDLPDKRAALIIRERPS
ncbi:GNAT family N-acetyltransferase [Mycolicibacillus trivialis]|uniref:Lysine N-acyltransferase MbtK n=1 Tax=Mycolicibacillus trivialis TaxID=1798 RepID=A0A1X2ENR0_9MYCO|nr:GNAT family N-acetyltransferase [Mycolicibacillus trivialis]ORX07312.1 GCN5 family acetyltransferase [Mycolicibacillus trivialis]